MQWTRLLVLGALLSLAACSAIPGSTPSPEYLRSIVDGAPFSAGQLADYYAAGGQTAWRASGPDRYTLDVTDTDPLTNGQRTLNFQLEWSEPGWQQPRSATLIAVAINGERTEPQPILQELQNQIPTPTLAQLGLRRPQEQTDQRLPLQCALDEGHFEALGDKTLADLDATFAIVGNRRYELAGETISDGAFIYRIGYAPPGDDPEMRFEYRVAVQDGRLTLIDYTRRHAPETTQSLSGSRLCDYMRETLSVSGAPQDTPSSTSADAETNPDEVLPSPDISLLRLGAPYSQARAILLRGGRYTPATIPDSERNCDWPDDYCRQYPEFMSCRARGTDICVLALRRTTDGRILQVLGRWNSRRSEHLSLFHYAWASPEETRAVMGQ